MQEKIVAMMYEALESIANNPECPKIESVITPGNILMKSLEKNCETARECLKELEEMLAGIESE